MGLKDKLAYIVSGRNRRKKFDFFIQTFRPDESTNILDIGAAEDEYSDTDNLLEKLYSYPRNITVLGIDKYNKFIEKYPNVTVHVYDGKIFPFANKYFDICWSNAVIEHIGDYERQVLFLKEINRVGKSAYLTTPNRFFPIEVHTRTLFIHYLPKAIFYWYLKLIGKGWATENYMFLLSYKDILKLLNDAGINDFIIKRNRLMFWTLDFVIMFGEKFEKSNHAKHTNLDLVCL